MWETVLGGRREKEGRLDWEAEEGVFTEIQFKAQVDNLETDIFC